MWLYLSRGGWLASLTAVLIAGAEVDTFALLVSGPSPLGILMPGGNVDREDQWILPECTWN
jgi:hypothetical protein